ncbi:hypothetical protein PanWU01x14_036320 [Parasponia andersonii]|uniref:Uncharacterized protein n=1 Tax=Parasponia andersonii TaxID=3476 RepID=A0A2P5DSE6_PARAD|nr:hypothetical protein PanWU01x14_036320 [Parasponia andersonii]
MNTVLHTLLFLIAKNQTENLVDASAHVITDQGSTKRNVLLSILLAQVYLDGQSSKAVNVIQQQHLRLLSQPIPIGLRNLQSLKNTKNYPIHIEQEEFTT